MKLRYIFLIICVVIIAVAVYLFLTFCDMYTVKAVAVESGTTVDKSEVTGRLDFGEVLQGEQVTRTVVLENAGDNDHSIRIWMIGSITQAIDIEPGTSFELEAGTRQDVDFTLTMPDSASEGKKLSGRVIIVKLP